MINAHTRNMVIIVMLAGIIMFIIGDDLNKNGINRNISYKIIGLTEAKDKYDGGEYRFFDARNEIFYKNAHIKGAVNVTLKEIKNNMGWYKANLPKDTKIIVYCSRSECSSSYDLANYLIERGYRHIEVFFGGWEDWVNGSYPIEEDELNDKPRIDLPPNLVPALE